MVTQNSLLISQCGHHVISTDIITSQESGQFVVGAFYLDRKRIYLNGFMSTGGII